MKRKKERRRLRLCASRSWASGPSDSPSIASFGPPRPLRRGRGRGAGSRAAFRRRDSARAAPRAPREGSRAADRHRRRSDGRTGARRGVALRGPRPGLSRGHRQQRARRETGTSPGHARRAQRVPLPLLFFRRRWSPGARGGRAPRIEDTDHFDRRRSQWNVELRARSIDRRSVPGGGGRAGAALGLAEADPSADLDGTDIARKLAVLAQTGFGVNLSADAISRQGIDASRLGRIHVPAGTTEPYACSRSAAAGIPASRPGSVPCGWLRTTRSPAARAIETRCASIARTGRPHSSKAVGPERGRQPSRSLRTCSTSGATAWPGLAARIEISAPFRTCFETRIPKKGRPKRSQVKAFPPPGGGSKGAIDGRAPFSCMLPAHFHQSPMMSDCGITVVRMPVPGPGQPGETPEFLRLRRLFRRLVAGSTLLAAVADSFPISFLQAETPRPATVRDTIRGRCSSATLRAARSGRRFSGRESLFPDHPAQGACGPIRPRTRSGSSSGPPGAISHLFLRCRCSGRSGPGPDVDVFKRRADHAGALGGGRPQRLLSRAKQGLAAPPLSGPYRGRQARTAHGRGPGRHRLRPGERLPDSFLFTAVPPVTESQLYQSAGPTLPDQEIGTGRSSFSCSTRNGRASRRGQAPAGPVPARGKDLARSSGPASRSRSSPPRTRHSSPFLRAGAPRSSRTSWIRSRRPGNPTSPRSRAAFRKDRRGQTGREAPDRDLPSAPVPAARRRERENVPSDRGSARAKRWLFRRGRGSHGLATRKRSRSPELSFPKPTSEDPASPSSSSRPDGSSA